MTIKQIKLRFKAEETLFGKFCVKIIGGIGTLCTVSIVVLEHISITANEWIPDYIKSVVGIMALVGVFYGKMTVKKQN